MYIFHVEPLIDSIKFKLFLQIIVFMKKEKNICIYEYQITRIHVYNSLFSREWIIVLLSISNKWNINILN